MTDLKKLLENYLLELHSDIVKLRLEANKLGDKTVGAAQRLDSPVVFGSICEWTRAAGKLEGLQAVYDRLVDLLKSYDSATES